MAAYRRASIPGATGVFTVKLAERRDNRWLIDKIAVLRWACAYAKERRPCRLEAVVIWPDPLHGIGTLPPDDTAFSTRWNWLKGTLFPFPRTRRANLAE